MARHAKAIGISAFVEGLADPLYGPHHERKLDPTRRYIYNFE
jgi:hypothetical protein